MSREIAYRKALGVRMKALRKKEGLTQVDFAERIEVAQPSIVRYESGERLPDAFVIMKIADQFKCDLTWLIFGDRDQA